MNNAVENIRKMKNKIGELPKTTKYPSAEVFKLSSDFSEKNNEHIEKCQYFINDLTDNFCKFISEKVNNKKIYSAFLEDINTYKEFIENSEHRNVYEEYKKLKIILNDLKEKEEELSTFKKIEMEDEDFKNIQLVNVEFDRDVVDFLDSRIIYEKLSSDEEISNLEKILEFIIGDKKEKTSSF